MSRHAFTGVGIRNATAGRKAASLYSRQFGYKCDECGDDSLGRRTRCKKCKLLVCSWCYHHIHSDKLDFLERHQ